MKYIFPLIIVLLLIVGYFLSVKEAVVEPLGSESQVRVIEETPEYRIIENGKTREKIYK